MRIQRRFTNEGESPYTAIEFRTTSSEIRNPDGSVVFSAADIEVPAAWTQVACDILAQKYFRKAGVPARLKPVKEDDVPEFLWRHAADEAKLKRLGKDKRQGGETDARQVFDRLAGEKGKVPLAWLLHSPLALRQEEGSIIGGGNGKPGLLITPDTATREASKTVFGKGYAAVPVSYHENYKPLDAWRDDVPYLRINSETDATLGGQTYGVLLAPFRKTPPKVAVLTQNVPDTTRLDIHAVAIQWPDRTDILTVDYRNGKTTCRIERKDGNGTTLWSEE